MQIPEYAKKVKQLKDRMKRIEEALTQLKRKNKV
jgi:hypothetical protein